MEIFMSLLLMAGGVAVFLYGMKLMSSGMEQSAGTGLRTLFRKLNKNRFADYGVGIAATAIMQSSSATSVMTIGLANAKIINNKQGSGIILGAKVGTTLTAFLFALSGASMGGFSISNLIASLAFVGVLMSLTAKKEQLQKIAIFLTGFGMLFLGLEVMEFAIGGKNSVLSVALSQLFTYEFMMNPVLLLLLGVVFTCVIQSSTAAIGIFIAFLKTGVLSSVDQSFFLVMGANIGTCLDGLIASLGSNTNGKRIAVFHVLTSAIGAIAFAIIVAIFRTPITNFFENTFALPEWSLATFNLLYNIIYTLILLACINPLVTLVNKIVKDKPSEEQKLKYIDDRFLITPKFAIEQTLKEVYDMADLAKVNITRAFDAIINEDMSQSKKIASDEYQIDFATGALANYIIKISSRPIALKDENLLGGLHHVITDIERIGDHAVVFAKETNFMLQNELKFSEDAKEELKAIQNKITKMYELCLETFKTRKTVRLNDISVMQKDIKDSVLQAKNSHAMRLKAGRCNGETSKSFYAAVLSQERIADHLVNVSFSILSNTGNKSEAFSKMESAKIELPVKKRATPKK